MYASAALRVVQRRMGSPLSWIAVAVFGGLFGLWTVSLLLARGYALPIQWVMIMVAPMGMAFHYGLLSPLPWHWTGDEAPMAPLWRGVLQGLVFNSLLMVLLWLLDTGLLAWAARLAPSVRTYQPHLTFPYLFHVPFLLLMGLFIAMAERSEQGRARAEQDAQEARWINLKAQLSPHVLFNTLNALAELARRDPVATERAILDLSDLYERMLHHGDRLAGPLGDEQRILALYLNLQALRLGTRLNVEWAWEEGLDGIPAPPMLLQPLVENALKHGIAPHPGPGLLRLEGRREGDQVVLAVLNTGRPLEARAKGTGLTNLEARLALAYGGQARFSLESLEGWTRAEIRFRPETLRWKA
jgi:hypothetical protein